MQQGTRGTRGTTDVRGVRDVISVQPGDRDRDRQRAMERERKKQEEKIREIRETREKESRELGDLWEKGDGSQIHDRLIKIQKMELDLLRREQARERRLEKLYSSIEIELNERSKGNIGYNCAISKGYIDIRDKTLEDRLVGFSAIERENGAFGNDTREQGSIERKRNLERNTRITESRAKKDVIDQGHANEISQRIDESGKIEENHNREKRAMEKRHGDELAQKVKECIGEWALLSSSQNQESTRIQESNRITRKNIGLSDFIAKLSKRESDYPEKSKSDEWQQNAKKKINKMLERNRGKEREFIINACQTALRSSVKDFSDTVAKQDPILGKQQEVQRNAKRAWERAKGPEKHQKEQEMIKQNKKEKIEREKRLLIENIYQIEKANIDATNEAALSDHKNRYQAWKRGQEPGLMEKLDEIKDKYEDQTGRDENRIEREESERKERSEVSRDLDKKREELDKTLKELNKKREKERVLREAFDKVREERRELEGKAKDLEEQEKDLIRELNAIIDEQQRRSRR